MKTKFAFIFLFLSVSSFCRGQGNLVINGGFDTSASGWTLSNIDDGFGFGTTYGNPGGGILLDSLTPSPSTDPTASQTINGLIPGTTYIVSGDYQKQKDRGTITTPSTVYSFGAGIGNDFLFEAASSTNIDLTWYDFNFYYTATSTSALLFLSSQINGTGVSYSIDNITMYAVPEPSPSWLLLLGGGVLFYARNRKSHTSKAICKK